MRRIALISVGLLVAGCGAVGQTAGIPAHGTSPLPPGGTQQSAEALRRTLPGVSAADVARGDASAGVARGNTALPAGEGWLSGPRNEYNLSLDAAGQMLVFARSDEDFKDARIWFARREGDGWATPAQAPFSDPHYKDSDPWLTPDGRTLYFVSNRPVSGDAANSNLDIWRVAVDAAGFGTPEHLPALASQGEELGPELHDGWLYFNSSRKGGPAQMSIYRAQVNGRGFDAPQPMPAPFNDGRIQGDFTLSPDGRIAVFWSRRGNSDELDLFAACQRPTAWSRAVRLPAPVNGTGMDFTPAFSADGRTLYYASLRVGIAAADAPSVLNGQSNLYAAPAKTVHDALDHGCVGSARSTSSAVQSSMNASHRSAR